MTQYKPLIDVDYNDEEHYGRKRKISYAGESSQGKGRYRKVFHACREIEIILLGESLRAIKNGKNAIRNISRDQK